jgi:NAD(P)-dependent dehydrogenase (short-subunit alcohol dehydrogenase family)
MDLASKTVLVTGAGSGLGAATARMLAHAGAQVVLADLNDASALATELAGAFIRTDVTQDADGQAAVALALARFGALHGLVNCAGVVAGERVVGRNGPHDLAAFTRVVTINLIGTFNMTRLAAAAMKANPPGPEDERGVIVSTASVAAFDGQIGKDAYSASKAGIVGMMLPIAREFARYGIRVMTVAPGLFKTPLLATLPQEAQASLGRQVPFPSRLGEPDEFAQLVEHIVVNPMLNGEVIRLDGAIRMAPK